MSAGNRANTERRGSATVLNVAMILVFVAIVLAPLFSIEWRAEESRWQLAAVRELILDGEMDVAETAFDAIDLSVLRSDVAIRLSVVDTLLELGRYQKALDECQAIKKEGYLREVRETIEVQFMDTQARCLNYLGRGKDALKIVKERYRELLPKNAPTEFRLNHIAYQRALANTELGPARLAATKLIESKGRSPMSGTDEEFWEMPFVVRSVVACGWLEATIDCQLSEPLALKMLDSEIANAEKRLDAGLFGFLGSAYEQMIEQPFPPNRSALKSIFKLRSQKNAVQDQLAMLLLVRSMVYRQTDNEVARNNDLCQIRELGYDVETLAENLPGAISSMKQVAESSHYADTLGYVLFRQQDWENAKAWLELAVMAAEYVRAVEESNLVNRYVEIYVDPRESERRTRHTLATIYRHRQQLREATGDQTGASRDGRRIQTLGFSSDAVLF